MVHPKKSKGGFQLWHLINFFFGLIWQGMFFVLVQTFILEVIGSAADMCPLPATQ